jgi:hypothetical protein
MSYWVMSIVCLIGHWYNWLTPHRQSHTQTEPLCRILCRVERRDVVLALEMRSSIARV